MHDKKDMECIQIINDAYERWIRGEDISDIDMSVCHGLSSAQIRDTLIQFVKLKKNIRVLEFYKSLPSEFTASMKWLMDTPQYLQGSIRKQTTKGATPQQIFQKAFDDVWQTNENLEKCTKILERMYAKWGHRPAHSPWARELAGEDTTDIDLTACKSLGPAVFRTVMMNILRTSKNYRILEFYKTLPAHLTRSMKWLIDHAHLLRHAIEKDRDSFDMALQNLLIQESREKQKVPISGGSTITSATHRRLLEKRIKMNKEASKIVSEYANILIKIRQDPESFKKSIDTISRQLFEIRSRDADGEGKITKQQPDSILMRAMLTHDKDIVRRVLDAIKTTGAIVSEDSQHPYLTEYILSLTSSTKDAVPILEMVINELGYDVNVRDVDGNTPLSLAVSRNLCNVVKSLLSEGANINMLIDADQLSLDRWKRKENFTKGMKSLLAELKQLLENMKSFVEGLPSPTTDVLVGPTAAPYLQVFFTIHLPLIFYKYAPKSTDPMHKQLARLYTNLPPHLQLLFNKYDVAAIIERLIHNPKLFKKERFEKFRSSVIMTSMVYQKYPLYGKYQTILANILPGLPMNQNDRDDVPYVAIPPYEDVPRKKPFIVSARRGMRFIYRDDIGSTFDEDEIERLPEQLRLTYTRYRLIPLNKLHKTAARAYEPVYQFISSPLFPGLYRDASTITPDDVSMIRDIKQQTDGLLARIQQENTRDLQLAKKYRQVLPALSDVEIDRLFDPTISEKQLIGLIPDDGLRQQIITDMRPAFAVQGMARRLQTMTTGLVSTKKSFIRQNDRMKRVMMDIIINLLRDREGQRLTFCIIDVQNVLYSMDADFRNKKKTLERSFHDMRQKIKNFVKSRRKSVPYFVWVMPGPALSLTRETHESIIRVPTDKMDDDKVCLMIYNYITIFMEKDSPEHVHYKFPEYVDVFILSNDRFRDWYAVDISQQHIMRIKSSVQDEQWLTGGGAARSKKNKKK